MKKRILTVLLLSLAFLLSCSKPPPSESAKKKCTNNDCTKAVNNCPADHTCGGETCELHKDCYKGFVCSKEKNARLMSLFLVQIQKILPVVMVLKTTVDQIMVIKMIVIMMEISMTILQISRKLQKNVAII